MTRNALNVVMGWGLCFAVLCNIAVLITLDVLIAKVPQTEPKFFFGWQKPLSAFSGNA